MNDLGVKPLKGEDRPIISEQQRALIIDNIKSVDYVILSEVKLNLYFYIKKYKITSKYKEKLLWEEYIPIIMELKPDMIFTLEETIKYNSILSFINEFKMKIIYTEYNTGISTTKIVNMLKNNEDKKLM